MLTESFIEKVLRDSVKFSTEPGDFCAEKEKDAAFSRTNFKKTKTHGEFLQNASSSHGILFSEGIREGDRPCGFNSRRNGKY